MQGRVQNQRPEICQRKMLLKKSAVYQCKKKIVSIFIIISIKSTHKTPRRYKAGKCHFALYSKISRKNMKCTESQIIEQNFVLKRWEQNIRFGVKIVIAENLIIRSNSR